MDAKRTFVRTLQGLSILPQDDDSDHYLENDVIINTMIDNAIKPEDILSQDECDVDYHEFERFREHLLVEILVKCYMMRGIFIHFIYHFQIL